MRKLATQPRPLKASATLILLSMCIAGGNASAQSPPGQSQSAQATQLPLSGRATQSGSVTATQSSTPGAASTVNTLNPMVQVQGAYSGSTSGISNMPFSGKLSLRDAIRRGQQWKSAETLGQLSQQFFRRLLQQLADSPPFERSIGNVARMVIAVAKYPGFADRAARQRCS